MIKTAVIGYGFSAKYFHISFIQYLPEFQLVAVSTSHRNDVNKNLSSIICYQTADELIQMTDAVTPHVDAKDALFIIFLLHLAEKSSEQGRTIWL